MYKKFFPVFFILLLLPLLSCSNAVQEFQLYSTAFDLQNETAQKVLDKIASAERAHWAVIEKHENPRGAFDPNDAAYYVNVGDPPLTGSMRSTLAAVKAYNQALIGLANGEASAALEAKTVQIVTNLTAAQSSLASAAKFASIPSIPNVAPSYLGAAKTVFEAALNAAARQSFRENLVKGFPHIKKVLLTFRNETPNLYKFVAFKPPRTTPQERAEDRELFASWVLLIDQTIATMEIAVKAAMQTGSTADIDTLADYSIELRILADKLKTEQNR